MEIGEFVAIAVVIVVVGAFALLGAVLFPKGKRPL